MISNLGNIINNRIISLKKKFYDKKDKTIYFELKGIGRIIIDLIDRNELPKLDSTGGR